MTSVLVIDDEQRLRTLIRHMLEAEGHEVYEAGNGTEGIRVYHQKRPELVICDIFMPEKDGLETVRELHSHFPELKIVAMSGGSPMLRFQNFLPLSLQVGAITTLAKPFNRATLLAAVQTALGATN